MVVIKCDSRECSYNFRGFCEAKTLKIQNRKCLTFHSIREYQGKVIEEVGTNGHDLQK